MIDTTETNEPTRMGKDLFLSAKSVRDRYDSVSDMTLFRWLRDPRMAFPAPIYFGRRRYWKLADLVAWERSRAPGGVH